MIEGKKVKKGVIEEIAEKKMLNGRKCYMGEKRVHQRK